MTANACDQENIKLDSLHDNLVFEDCYIKPLHT